MTENMDILKIIAENPTISQRKIAEQTGISLGQVNFLIKKCVRKGFVKIEGQTPKSIKYNLTPKGFAKKAALTLDYVKVSYGAVIALTHKIRTLAKHYESEGKTIYVYGAEDEMMEICKIALGDKAIYFTVGNKNLDFELTGVLLLWEDLTITVEDFRDIEAVNILL